MGVGGKEHKYLQSFIKQVAEDRGYRAVIEHEISDGTGRVDVTLKSESVWLACEISITTTGEQELRNVEKCLGAGFNEVIVVSSKPKHLRRIERYVRKHLEAGYEEGVLFLLPEDLIAHLDEIAAQAQTREETVRGYKVTTTHTKVDPSEAEARRKAMVKVIAGSLKKMKDKPTATR